jgi:molybdopterin molybdotransferase
MKAQCYESGQGLLAEDEALRLLCKEARPVDETERVTLANARGRILSEPQVAPIDVPYTDNSAMDGYAVRAQDISDTDTTRLVVTQRIPAGTTGTALTSGTAARIFTGAAIPPGADAVLMQEDCERQGDDVLINGPVDVGMNIRRAGEDITCGSEILAKGTKIQPQHIGLAASAGLSDLPVFRKVRVAVFFSGDELQTPGQPLAAGKIYNSNRYVLTGLLQQLGCDVIELGDIADNMTATTKALEQARDVADLIITSGGVSVGEEDHVKTAITNLGQLKLWKIAVKPGKPLVFAYLNSTPFIGLPGNPVSVFITFCLYARVYISLLQGQTYSMPKFMWVMAGFERRRAHNRREYLRARIETDPAGNNIAQLYPHQGSGVLSSIAWADGVVCIPEKETISRGQMVRYLSFSSLFI